MKEQERDRDYGTLPMPVAPHLPHLTLEMNLRGGADNPYFMRLLSKAGEHQAQHTSDEDFIQVVDCLLQITNVL